MQVPATERSFARLGPFEADLTSHELRHDGSKIKLQDMPFQILAILLERPGELVTREEFRQRLWPSDTFVDFEHSINTAVKKLREALEDDAGQPRYIETLPKKGYRFIARVETVPNAFDPVLDLANVPSAARDVSGSVHQAAPSKRFRWQVDVAAVLVLAIAAGTVYWHYRPRTPVVTGIHQLTRTNNGKWISWLHKVVSDGTRIYFNDLSNSGLSIAQVSTQGGEVSYLTMPVMHEPLLVGGSADGSKLLVFDAVSDVADRRLWLAQLPNGPQRKIDEVTVTFATLTPDGGHVFFTNSSDTRKLQIVDVDGSNRRVVLTAPDRIRDFAVSPDGKIIRFVAGYRIWEASVDGTGLHRFLPRHDRKMCCGGWSADGRTYSFASLGNDGYNLWATTESGPSGHIRQAAPMAIDQWPNFLPGRSLVQ